jgi:ubiquinone/menaquinone biosynthesis C-methylase UbiE
LGGHRITLSGFKQLIGTKKSVTVCEIGCGGGDNWRPIRNWCRRNKIGVRYLGIDLNPDCIRFARQQNPDKECSFLESDYARVDLERNKPDIVFSSLFCHHFDEAQLAYMLHWMRANAVIGFFINDLHRHWFAYYSIKWLSSVFSRSYLVKNDAPLSVRRGFVRSEWISLFKIAGVPDYSINWRWAFRWLIVSKNVPPA